MTTFKDALCLLAIFIAYGVVGRLDYEDAVLLEHIGQERRAADCLRAWTPDVRGPVAPINEAAFDPRSGGADADPPNDRERCALHGP